MKVIPEWGDKYYATEDGKIWDSESERFISQVLTGGVKYYYVNLRHPKTFKRKLVRVHRLIALTFIPNPDNLPMVDHIDRDKYNNHVSNLRWIDKHGNARNMDCNRRVSYKGEDWLLVDALRDYYGDGWYSMSGYFASRFSREGTVFEDILEEDRVRKFLSAHKIPRKLYMERLELGWSEWNIKEGISPFTVGKPCGVDIKKEVIHKGWEYGYCPLARYEVNGEVGTKDYFFQKYNVTNGSWEVANRKDITMEDFCLRGNVRFKWCRVNGERMLVKDMWKMFGLNPKRCNNINSKLGGGKYLEVLKSLGIDTSGLIILKN